MLFSVISFIIGLLITYFFFDTDKSVPRGKRWFWNIFLGFWVGFAIAIVLHACSYPFTVETTYRTKTKPIVAAKVDSRISGHMEFYWIGRIDEIDYYFVITDDGGLYKQRRVPVESTVIVETDDKPYIKIKEKYAGSSLPEWVRIKCKPNILVGEEDTIFVPRGTISSNSKFEIF